MEERCLLDTFWMDQLLNPATETNVHCNTKPVLYQDCMDERDYLKRCRNNVFAEYWASLPKVIQSKKSKPGWLKDADPRRRIVLLDLNQNLQFPTRILKCSIATELGSNSFEKTPEVVDLRDLSSNLGVLNGYLCITGDACCSCGNSRCFLGSNKCLTYTGGLEQTSGYLYLPVYWGQKILDICPDDVSPLTHMAKNEEGTFYGPRKNGVFHGKGKYIWTNGDSYEGMWSEGKIHGKGTLNFANGSKYKGEFHLGKRHGQGKMRNREGIYIGQWRNDLKHGEGVLNKLEHKKKLRKRAGVWSEGYMNESEGGSDNSALSLSAEEILAAISSGVCVRDRLAALSPILARLPSKIQERLTENHCVAWDSVQQSFRAVPVWKELRTIARRWLGTNASARSLMKACEEGKVGATPQVQAPRVSQWSFLYSLFYIGDILADLAAIHCLQASFPSQAMMTGESAVQRRRLADAREARRKSQPSPRKVALGRMEVGPEAQLEILGCRIPSSLCPAFRQLRAGQILLKNGDSREARRWLAAAIDLLITRAGPEGGQPSPQAEDARQRILLIACMERTACCAAMRPEEADQGLLACGLREAMAELDFCMALLDADAHPVHLLATIRSDLADLLHFVQRLPAPPADAGEPELPDEPYERAEDSGMKVAEIWRRQLREMGAVGGPNECPVCLAEFFGMEPGAGLVAVLPCGHALCRHCLDILNAPDGPAAVLCPTCQQPAAGDGGSEEEADARRSRRDKFVKKAQRCKDTLSASIRASCEVLRQARRRPAPAADEGPAPASVGLLRAVANPLLRGAVGYGSALDKGPEDLDGRPDSSQSEVINGLSLELEGIHGPPGTGKSQTIVHIIAERLPPDEVVLVVCMQNRAVEALVQKLERRSDIGFLVLGSPTNDKLGPVAAHHILWARIERDGGVILSKMALEVLDEQKKRRGKLKSSSKQTEDTMEEKLQWKKERDECLGRVNDAEQDARDSILAGVRVLVGTVGASQWLHSKQHFFDQLNALSGRRIRTIILDEAGSVPEHRLPVLLALRPDRFLLVGDHNQLQPFSAVTDEDGPPPRSLLQRLAKVIEDPTPSGNRRRHRGRLPMLRVQYRMHPALARFVSQAFYGGLLRTDREVLVRLAAAGPLAWPGSGAFPAPLLPGTFDDSGGETVCGPVSRSPGIVWLDYNSIDGPAERRSESRSWWNPTEVALTLRSVRYLLAAVAVAAPACGGCRGERQCVSTSKRVATQGANLEAQMGGMRVADGHGCTLGSSGTDPRGVAAAQWARTVMVITFYKAQAEAVDREARADEGLRAALDCGALRVVTVDGAQGSEADFVVLSAVRCNHIDGGGCGGRGEIGFLHNKNRLCVATSRARQLLVVVGHAATLLASCNHLLHELYKAAGGPNGTLRAAELGLMQRRWFWLARALLMRWRPTRAQVGRALVLSSQGMLDAFCAAEDETMKLGVQEEEEKEEEEVDFM